MRGRYWESMITVTTYIGLVLIFICLSSVTEGLSGVFSKAGSEDVAVVRSAGASFGNVTLLTDGIVDEVAHSEQVFSEQDFDYIFPEYQTLVKLYKPESNIGDPVRFRGVVDNIGKLRNQFKVIEGRNVESGRYEVIVGKGLMESHSLKLGEKLNIEDQSWEVVGVFENGGDVRESELWTDIGSLQSAYDAHSKFFLVFVKLRSFTLLKKFKYYLEKESSQLVEVVSEQEYFSKKAQDLTRFVELTKMVVVPIMALCVVFCTLATAITLAEQRKWLNNLYLALGFSRNSIFTAHCVESIAIGLFAGLLGSGLAYCFFDGYQASSFDTATTVLYRFSVSWIQVGQSVMIIIGISMLGSFYPAYQSSRQPTSSLLAED